MTELSFPFEVEGTVVHGANRGKALGFPTANLDAKLPDDYPHGIYAAWVQKKEADIQYPAAVYWGTRPTFAGKEPILEVYLLDESANLYDQTLTVTLIDLIRADQSFNSADELIAQVHKDVVAVRRRLARN